MKAVVVYESMYGNTHVVAEAIGEGLRPVADVEVVPVEQATPGVVADADLLVVGGPTHVHGMARPSSRKAAIEAANKPGSDLELDLDAGGPGLREWFEALQPLQAKGAAFDTRIDQSPLVTGRASKGIARRLRKHGCTLVDDPTSFLVTKASQLENGEEQRAREWGEQLASSMETTSPAAGSA